MSLKLLLLATFLVDTACSSPDVAVCGADGLCREEEPKAQDAAQGLLSMGYFAHHPLGNPQAAPVQKPVTHGDAKAQPEVAALPPRTSPEVHAQKQADVPASNPLSVHRLPRKSTLAVVQDSEKNARAHGKESKVQALERSTKRLACTPCEFKLYTKENCKGAPVDTINLGCGRDTVCRTKQEVAGVAKVVSIEGTRKACEIRLKTDKGKTRWFGKSGDFPGCVNIDTKENGIPEAIITADKALCRSRRR